MVVEDQEEEEPVPSDEKQNQPTPVVCIPKVPFPHALQGLPLVDRSVDILEVFQQVKINIPLLDAIHQFPAYAKFLKDLCTHKRMAKQVTKKVLLTKQVSALL